MSSRKVWSTKWMRACIVVVIVSVMATDANAGGHRWRRCCSPCTNAANNCIVATCGAPSATCCQPPGTGKRPGHGEPRTVERLATLLIELKNRVDDSVGGGSAEKNRIDQIFQTLLGENSNDLSQQLRGKNVTKGDISGFDDRSEVKSISNSLRDLASQVVN